MATEELQNENQRLLQTIEQALILLSRSGQSFNKDDLLLKIDQARKLLAKALDNLE